MEQNAPKLYFFRFSALLIAACCIFSVIGIFAPRDRVLAVGENFERPLTVVIDPGHGGEDGGACTYGGLPEKELNLLISDEVYKMLSTVGINAVMTRSEDILLYDPTADYVGHKKSMDLAARLKIAEDIPNSILVSIHMNAFPEEKYSGLQVYFSKNTESSARLATLIQNNTQLYLCPDNKRKAKAADRGIYLLNRFSGTGVLIECGFLSNPEERELLNSEDYRRELATVIFCSLLQYISEGGE